MTNTTNAGTLGGGEVLPFIGQDTHKGTQYIDWDLAQQFAALPLVKILICVLLLTLLTVIIMRLFNIKSFRKGKGITSEINNVNEIKSRDKFILQSNKWLGRITRLVQKTPFNIPSNTKEYMQYNLNRAGIKVPGGFRNMSAEEFNAIVKLTGVTMLVLGLLVTLLFSSIFGLMVIVSTIVITGILPMKMVRQVVKEKDREIKENFSDFYLMLHYVLIIGGQTPLDKLMRSYAKTTDSLEMARFVDNCVGHIDTNGEYGATMLIARDYREIAEVGKLMRLIKQMYDGADIQQELLGFRAELMKEKKYIIEKKMNKLIANAQRSFNILTIILIQAIISAMALYLPDISSITTFF